MNEGHDEEDISQRWKKNRMPGFFPYRIVICVRNRGFSVRICTRKNTDCGRKQFSDQDLCRDQSIVECTKEKSQAPAYCRYASGLQLQSDLETLLVQDPRPCSSIRKFTKQYLGGDFYPPCGIRSSCTLRSVGQ